MSTTLFKEVGYSLAVLINNIEMGSTPIQQLLKWHPDVNALARLTLLDLKIA